jgi:hypothetical protein
MTKYCNFLQKIGFQLRGLPDQAPGISIREAQDRLECNEKGTLLTLLRKQQGGDALSRAEWNFLAYKGYRTYDSAYHELEVVDRELLTANLRAFAAVVRLRDEQYPHLSASDENDYYWGNLNFSKVERNVYSKDLQAHVQACIEALPANPHSGYSIFSCRNLDVFLRDEPPLDGTRLNQALKPYLRALLLVALYGYWKDNDEAIVTEKDHLDGRRKIDEELRMKNIVYLPAASNEHFHLTPTASESSIGIAITSRQHPYIFTLNNYIELMQFSDMFERLTDGSTKTSMPGFELYSLRSGDQFKYLLASGRWHHTLTTDEFEAMKNLLKELFAATEVRAHLNVLELIYGRI